jgi:IclR family acetate operon transcriptional repressor
MTTTAPDYSIAVVVRTLDLLETLAAASAPLGPTELAARLGTTKSAAYRILATLEQRGYVRKDPVTAQYRLGTRLAYLGERSLAALDLRRAARGALETLYQRFHETVNLGVREGQEIVYIDMIESDQDLRMAARLGGRDALHATALGKAILAYLPEQQRTALLAGSLAARTPHTITDHAALAQELDHIRAVGMAEDREENELGARCFGAPIFDHTGAVVAAVSIAAPATRLDNTRAGTITTALATAARDITTTLGGRAPEMG